MSVPKDDIDLEMKNEFENSLAKKQGLKFPRFGTLKYYSLKYFYKNKNKIIFKQELDLLKNPPGDNQYGRHLRNTDGFSILQGGETFNNIQLKVRPEAEYVFTGFDTIDSKYYLGRRNEGIINFEECKKRFNYSCATCGSIEGQPHRFTGKITLLEKGHMDPNLPLEQSNLIPQCDYCNKKYKNRFIFDEYGQIKYYTDEELEKQYKLKQERNNKIY